MASIQPGIADDVIGGNVYPKYTTRNPLVQLLVRNFVRTFHRLVAPDRRC